MEVKEVNSERESGRRHLGNIIVRASLRRYMTASLCTNLCTNSLRYMSLSLTTSPRGLLGSIIPRSFTNNLLEGLGLRVSLRQFRALSQYFRA